MRNKESALIIQSGAIYSISSSYFSGLSLVKKAVKGGGAGLGSSFILRVEQTEIYMPV
jgi:hypothetical protein